MTMAVAQAIVGEGLELAICDFSWRPRRHALENIDGSACS